MGFDGLTRPTNPASAACVVSMHSGSCATFTFSSFLLLLVISMLAKRCCRRHRRRYCCLPPLLSSQTLLLPSVAADVDATAAGPGAYVKLRAIRRGGGVLAVHVWCLEMVPSRDKDLQIWHQVTNRGGRICL